MYFGDYLVFFCHFLSPVALLALTCSVRQTLLDDSLTNKADQDLWVNDGKWLKHLKDLPLCQAVVSHSRKKTCFWFVAWQVHVPFLLRRLYKFIVGVALFICQFKMKLHWFLNNFLHLPFHSLTWVSKFYKLSHEVSGRNIQHGVYQTTVPIQYEIKNCCAFSDVISLNWSCVPDAVETMICFMFQSL